MKNYLILSCIVFMIFGCQTDGDLNEQDEINLLKIENIYSLTGESKIISYRMLNANEKYHLWQRRHSEIIDLEKNKISSEQIKFINELYSGLKVEYFQSDAKRKYANYHYDYLPKMKKRGLTIFSMAEMNKYFSNWDSNTS